MSTDLDGLRDLARVMRKVASDLETGGDTEELIGAYLRRFIYLNPRIAVIGQEGAGKSTLVNGLLGAPYAPTHASRPATAAPIAFRSSEDGKQRWRIHAVDGTEHELSPEEALPLVVQFDVEVKSSSQASQSETNSTLLRRRRTFWATLALPFIVLFKIIFFPFFLFRKRVDVSKTSAPSRLALPPPRKTLRRQDVALAVADVPSPWLTNGVWLLDLPGVEGADAAFSARPPPPGLLDGAMIILVVRGRSIGPGVRLAAQLAKQHASVTTAIVNVTRDDIDDDTSASDVDGYVEAFADACTREQVKSPTGGVYVANVRMFGEAGQRDDVTPVLREHHQLLRNLLDNAFRNASAGQRADIIATGRSAERALRNHASSRTQLLDAFTSDLSKPVAKVSPELSAAIATAFAQFDDIVAPTFEAISAAVVAMSAARMASLRSYVAGVRSEVVTQRVVWSAHFKGRRERAHAQESRDIQSIRDGFENEAMAGIPRILQVLADRITQQNKHRTWPIDRVALSDYLARANTAAEAKLSAPALPALDANLSGWNAVNARAPTLAGFDQYLGFCDPAYYAGRNAKPLADALLEFKMNLRKRLEGVIAEWTAGDPAVRRAVSVQLSVLSAANSQLDEVEAKLGQAAE